MGFFTDAEAAALQIIKMNFQVVGDTSFQPRPAMQTVEQEAFFRERILALDVASNFSFADGSATRSAIEKIATSGRFSPGALALASDFHSRHVGQSNRGAFFLFELTTGVTGTKIFAMLKYDYSEVVATRNKVPADPSKSQLRRIVDAFVKDRRALQKSALIRVVNGVAETLVSATDRAARSPNITDFYAKFLDVCRERDDVELNTLVIKALIAVCETVEEHIWPDGDPAKAVAVAREILRTSTEIDETKFNEAIFVAAGRPTDPSVADELNRVVQGALRARRLTGLAFPPIDKVLRIAARRTVKTVENIRIDYPEQLRGVLVKTVSSGDGSAVITIKTKGIEVDEIVTESVRSIRRQSSPD